MKKLFTYLLIVSFFALLGCQESIKVVSGESSNAIDKSYANEAQTENLIAPYKKELDAQMNEVIVVCSEEMPREKGKPETKLGNLVADLSYEVASEMYDEEIDFCLLNFGGLRTNLPKGKITRGKVFELLPFENELVVVTISEEKLIELFQYLKRVGGQPISGFEIEFSDDEEDDLEDFDEGELKMLFDKDGDGSFRILTTDYLANGGDNMVFFANPINSERVGIKLRDAILQYFKKVHKEGKQLTSKLEGRISFDD